LDQWNLRKILDDERRRRNCRMNQKRKMLISFHLDLDYCSYLLLVGDDADFVDRMDQFVEWM